MTKVKTLLLTRPEAQSNALAQTIKSRLPDINILISPLLAIEPTGDFPSLEGVQAMIFTSLNGVAAFVKSGTTEIPCYCVGARTAQAAQTAGLNAISADGAADDLVALLKRDLSPKDGALLHIRGEHIAGDIATQLQADGFTVQEAVLYKQIQQPLLAEAISALATGLVDCTPLYSPRSARLFAAELAENPDWPTQVITAVCISENVAAELEGTALADVLVAENPSGEAMAALIARFCAESR